VNLGFISPFYVSSFQHSAVFRTCGFLEKSAAIAYLLCIACSAFSSNYGFVMVFSAVVVFSACGCFQLG
jgi:hypothetical protein